MAKTESSAITEFINANRQPILGGFDEAASQESELVLRNRVSNSRYAQQRNKLPPLPQPRAQLPQPRPPSAQQPWAPHGTPGPTWQVAEQPSLSKPKFRAVGTMPPPQPTAAPRQTLQAAAPPMPQPVVRGPSRLEIPPDLDSAHVAPAHALLAPIELEEEWFDSAPLDIDVGAFDSDDLDIQVDETRPVSKMSRGTVFALVFGGIAIAAAVAVGAYIATSGPGVDKSSTSSASAAGAVAGQGGGGQVKSDHADTTAAQPAADDRIANQRNAALANGEAPAQAIITPLENRVEFTTEPAGATVTLIDNGDPVVLGASPAATALEPGHSYEVMFTLPGYGTVLQPVLIPADGDTTISVALIAATAGPTLEEALAALPEEEATVPDDIAAPAPPAAAASEKAPTRDARRKKAEVKRAPATKTVAARAPKPAKAKAKAADNKMGTLMIGTKPPCEIYIDGKNTGLVAPQRDISLAPGKHKVTLVNKKFSLKKTFTVDIKAGGKTRLIRDWSDVIK